MSKKLSAYRLVRPCAHCPFRTDIPPYLRPARITEIERNQDNGGMFYCHETLDPERAERADDDPDEEGYYNPSGVEAHCAGALILLEKLNRPNQMMRIMERLGFYDRRKLDMTAPVFNTWAAMRRAQIRGQKRTA